MTPAVERTWSRLEVAELCRVSLRQLQWWRDERRLKPRRVGCHHVYTARDLRMVRILRDLREKGLLCATIRRLLPLVAKYEAGYLLIDMKQRKAFYCEDKAHAIRFAGRAGSAVHLIDLGGAE